MAVRFDGCNKCSRFYKYLTYVHKCAGTVLSENVYTMLIIREINEKISQASNLHKTCQPNRDENLRCMTQLFCILFL